MSTQYRLVQSGKTASGGSSAGQGSSEPVAPRIYFIYFYFSNVFNLSRRNTIVKYTITCLFPIHFISPCVIIIIIII
jgi:hypothetical protein